MDFVDEAFSAKSCSELLCLYGARCVMESGAPVCQCDVSVCKADGNEAAVTCGTDGTLYGSECQLKQVACRLQKDIRVANRRLCSKGWPYSLLIGLGMLSRRSRMHCNCLLLTKRYKSKIDQPYYFDFILTERDRFKTTPLGRLFWVTYNEITPKYELECQ